MEQNNTFLRLPQGKLQGKMNEGITIFHNIPYATAERFQIPQAPPSWEGVRIATEPRSRCPQLPSAFKKVIGELKNPPTMSEDCHRLSVCSPDLKGKKAVMVWIHGGSFVSSSGEEAWYNPYKLTSEGDVVTVNISYRLGVFGFLWWPEKGIKNLGIEDQIAALKWVKNNIAQFGGDPENITVFGQSAGAYSIAALLACLKEPLFNRAIIQSAPLKHGLSISQATKIRESFLTNLGKDPFSASVDEILEAQKKVLDQSTKGMTFSPIDIDLKSGISMPEKNIQLLLGWTKDDASPFVKMRTEKMNRKMNRFIERMLVHLITRLVFSKPALSYAAYCKTKGIDVKLYKLNWRPANSKYGACHAIDLPLLFGDHAIWKDSPFIGSTTMDELDKKAVKMRAAWVGFAKTGKISHSLKDLIIKE